MQSLCEKQAGTKQYCFILDLFCMLTSILYWNLVFNFGINSVCARQSYTGHSKRVNTIYTQEKMALK